MGRGNVSTLSKRNAAFIEVDTTFSIHQVMCLFLYPAAQSKDACLGFC